MTTVGMSRREKLQYEARIRRLTGTSKLPISMAAHTLIEDEDLINKLAKNSESSRAIADKHLDRYMKKVDSIKAAKWGDGGAYSPEVMHGTDEENQADWSNSGLADVANDTIKGEYYG